MSQNKYVFKVRPRDMIQKDIQKAFDIVLHK